MSANQELYDASVRHRVALLRLQNAIAEKLVAGPLRTSDRKLIAGLAALLATAQLSAGSIIGASTAPKIGRLAGVERFVNENASALEAAVLVSLIPSLVAIAESEAGWQVGAIAESVPPRLAEPTEVVAPPPDAVAKIAEAHPIVGDLLKNMVAAFVLNRAFKVMQRTRRGVTEGETVETIVSAIAGTKARAYRDGVLESGRRSSRALVNQAVDGTAAASREMVYRRNGRLLQGILWISVLDGKTSPQCRALSGSIFPVGVGPRPPIHIACRSTVAPIFRGDNAPPPPTYNDWLNRQPPGVQDEVLGPSRGALFRKGGLTVDKFVDLENGHQWTLDELRTREADAFSRAFPLQQAAVMKPAVTLKIAGLLQQGLTVPQTAAAIKLEYPTLTKFSEKSVAKVADKLVESGSNIEALTGALTYTPARVALADFEMTLPQNLARHAGKWATVTDTIEGSPGAYAFHVPGKGVSVSATELGAIGSGQARQVLAHEFSHFAHRDLGIVPNAKALAALKAAAKAAKINPELKRLYGYYLGSEDELIGEIYAQALSPSPLTSQGVRARRFNEVFGDHIAAARVRLGAVPLPPPALAEAAKAAARPPLTMADFDTLPYLNKVTYKADRASLMDFFNNTTKVHPDDLMNGQVSSLDYTVDLKKSWLDYNFGELKWQIDYTASDGSWAFQLTRTLDTKTMTLHAELFHVKSDLQHAGIGKDVLSTSLDTYKRMGVKRIELIANIDVGGYAWARYGYKPTQASWSKLKGDIRKAADPETLAKIAPLLESDDPRAIWAIADSREGKAALLGTNWKGGIDLDDAEAMARTNRYLGKGG